MSSRQMCRMQAAAAYLQSVVEKLLLSDTNDAQTQEASAVHQLLGAEVVNDLNTVAHVVAGARKRTGTASHTRFSSPIHFLASVRMPWDANRLGDRINKNTGLNAKSELKLMKSFPPLDGVDNIVAREAQGLQLRIISEPCVVTDMHGNVLLWSLPSVLPSHRQVCAPRRAMALTYGSL